MICVVYMDDDGNDLHTRLFDTDEAKEVFLEMKGTKAVVIHGDGDLEVEDRT
jgi:hypothetical protein